MDAFQRVWARIASYQVFPTRLMRFSMEPPGSIARGTLIVQRFCFVGLALEAAVRVVDIWDRQDGASRTAGFQYVTLAGHPERGVETFEVRLQPDGRVSVSIRARSEPAVFVARLGRSVARRVQVAATRAALRRLTDT